MQRFGWAILAAVAVVAAGCGGASESPKIRAASGEIAFTAGDGIYVVTADGGDARKVPGTDALSGPEWAPDGDRLAAVDLSDCCKAYSVTLQGSKSRLPADSSTTPEWAPDGKRLAAVDEETGRIRVVRIADGQVEVTLPKNGNNPVTAIGRSTSSAWTGPAYSRSPTIRSTTRAHPGLPTVLVSSSPGHRAMTTPKSSFAS